MLAPRNFETLIFNNSAFRVRNPHFSLFQRKKTTSVRTGAAFPSHSLATLTSAQVPARSDSRARRLQTFPLAPRAKVGYPILARHSIAFPRTRAREEIKFRRSEIPSSRTPVADHCDSLSPLVNTAHTVHNSSSAFAGARRPRQKTFLSPSARKIRSTTIARY